MCDHTLPSLFTRLRWRWKGWYFGACSVCVCATANFLRHFAWCVVCALTLSRTALMHLETAGEGPTNQVLQTHKSIATHLLFCCYFVLDVI